MSHYSVYCEDMKRFLSVASCETHLLLEYEIKLEKFKDESMNEQN